MANAEHVKMLESGNAEAWNDWRWKNPKITPDLNGEGGAEFREAILHNIDLRDVNLKGKLFIRGVFISADFRDSVLSFADFTNAKLSKANFGGAECSNGIFALTDLSKAVLVDGIFTDVDFSGANFEGAVVARANMTGANLRETGFSSADLKEVDFMDANLTNADLTRANLRKAKLISTNLTNAILDEVDCADADFTGADISGANFEFSKNLGQGQIDEAHYNLKNPPNLPEGLVLPSGLDLGNEGADLDPEIQLLDQQPDVFASQDFFGVDGAGAGAGAAEDDVDARERKPFREPISIRKGGTGELNPYVDDVAPVRPEGDTPIFTGTLKNPPKTDIKANVKSHRKKMIHARKGVFIIHGVAAFLGTSSNLNIEDAAKQALIAEFRDSVDILKNNLASAGDQVVALEEIIAIGNAEKEALIGEKKDLQKAVDDAVGLGKRCYETFCLRLSEKAADGVAIGVGLGTMYLVGKFGGDLFELFSGAGIEAGPPPASPPVEV